MGLGVGLGDRREGRRWIHRKGECERKIERHTHIETSKKR